MKKWYKRESIGYMSHQQIPMIFSHFYVSSTLIWEVNLYYIFHKAKTKNKTRKSKFEQDQILIT